MNNEIKKCLKDILTSIQPMDTHLSGKRDFFEYQNNLTVRMAIERELEIIAEATNRILKIDATFPVSYAKAIVSMRNRVIHSYDSVDDNLIWKIIVKDIPVLQKEVEELLK